MDTDSVRSVHSGEPVIGETFAIEDRPIDLDQELEKGSLLVKVCFRTHTLQSTS